jgi:DNA-binding transcriptional LysR family regulator
VVTAFSGYLLEWLHSGIVDIAVVYGSERMANLRAAPLLLETLHFVGGAGAAGPAGRAVPFAEVAARRLVLPGPEHGLRILVEEEARRRGLALDVLVEADSLQVQKGLVTKGLGATVLPLASVHAEVTAGLLRAAPITGPRLSRRLVVVEPLGRPASNAVRRFGQVLRDEVAAMVAGKVWDGRLLDA